MAAFLQYLHETGMDLKEGAKQISKALKDAGYCKPSGQNEGKKNEPYKAAAIMDWRKKADQSGYSDQFKMQAAEFRETAAWVKQQYPDVSDDYLRKVMIRFFADSVPMFVVP